MKRPGPSLSFLLVALLALVTWGPFPVRAETATVIEVFDGDTIRVRLDGGGEETVRYLLIDTPELHHPQRGEEEMGREAAEANRRLVQGQRVRLETDVLTRDRYGRMLAYVWLPMEEGEILVSRWLVEQGYALPFTLPPNVKYVDLIRQACRQARQKRAGLWDRAASRSFSASQAWIFLPSLKGHFLTMEMEVERVVHSGQRWLLLPGKGKTALVIFDSDQPQFGDLKRLVGKHIRATGKLREGYRGAQIYLRTPSQLLISTENTR